MTIRPLEESDRAWAEQVIRRHFGSARIVSRGVIHECTELPGLIAQASGTRLGLLQFHLQNGEIEVVVLVAVRKRSGIGTELLRALRQKAEAAGLRRIWLITTNNNRGSQAFYEAVGLRQCAVYPDAMLEARKLKTELPERDETGTPIRDEIEYEWPLKPRRVRSVRNRR